jgi:PAS domain S-box-containing protein
MEKGKEKNKEDSRRRLRDTAEAKSASSFQVLPDMQAKAPEALLHELQVHQIELEMQNEELRRIRLELEESRNKYADLYDFAPVGYFTFTREGSISEVNLTGAALLGLPRQALINVRFRRLVSPEDQVTWDRHLMSLLEQGGKQTCDLLLKREDDFLFHARLDSVTVETDSGTSAVRTVMGDISASGRRDETLQESKADYRSLFENMFNGFAYCRMLFENGRPKDFIYLNVNRAFEVLTGLKNVVGKKVSEVIPGIRESNPELFDLYARVALTGIPEQCETYIAPLNMWLLTAAHSPLKEYFVAIFDVITERKRAQDELRASEERYRSLVECTSDAIVLLSPEREVISCNRAFFNLFGFDPDELAGHSVRLMHPSDESYQRFGVIAYPQIENTGVFRGEWDFAGKNGRIIPCETVTSAIRDGSGSTMGYVGVLRDITERRHMEEALRVSENRYRTIFEDSLEAISIVQDGLIVDVNPAWLRLHDFPSGGEVIGTDIMRVLHPGDKDILRSRRTMAPEERNRGYEIRDVKSTGETIYVEVYSNVISLGGRDAILATIRDITGRREAERDLMLERERFKTLLHHAPFGIIMVGESGSLLYGNRKFENIFGYTSDDVPDGRTWLEKVFPDRRYRKRVMATWFEDMKGLREGEGIPRAFTVRCKDGRQRVISFIPVMLPQGREHLITCEDITERIENEGLLHDIRLRQQAILDNIPDMAWLKDKKGRFMMANESFGRTCGVKPEDLAGKTDLDIWPKELARRYRADDREVIKSGTRKRAEEPLEDREGRIRWIETIKTPIVSESGDVLGTTGIARDITKRKETEVALLTSYNQLEQAKLEWESSVDSLHELVFLLDGKGRILRSNRAIARWELGDVIDAQGQDLHAFLHRGCAKPHCYLRAFLAGGLEALAEGKEMEREEKDEILFKYLSVKMRPFVNNENNRSRSAGNYAVVTVSDITEHKEAEKTIREAYAELQEAQQELVRSEKLALLGKFSSGIAHEIRNPLANIRASAQFCLSKFGVGEDVKKHLRVMLRNTDIANKIIKELIDLAKPSEVSLKPGNIGNVINRVCELIKTRCEKQHVVLHKRWSKRLPAILMDEERMEKAFLNFVLNGLDAMARGGSLSINAYPDSQKQEVAVSILDTGKGISQENLEKIFHPFFTTKRDGIGLGLCLAEQVISSHKGTVTISSHPGQGTEVVLRLKVSRQAATTEAV